MIQYNVSKLIQSTPEIKRVCPGIILDSSIGEGATEYRNVTLLHSLQVKMTINLVDIAKYANWAGLFTLASNVLSS